jgi:hypothetical protein
MTFSSYDYDGFVHFIINYGPKSPPLKICDGKLIIVTNGIEFVTFCQYIIANPSQIKGFLVVIPCNT